MKISNGLTIILSLLLIGMVGCGSTVTTFYYRMAEAPTGDEGLMFYVPPVSEVKRVSPAHDNVRNVILCIGDGMGYEHVALARHYGPGDNKKLYMELLPVRGEVVTRSANNEVTDSAAAATAMACGVKTNNGMIGMTPDKTPHSSVMELLQQKGWRTGLVATSTISHATPAGFASHVDSRNKQKEIAEQLLNRRVDVMFGGGQKHWSDALLDGAAAAGYQVVKTRDEMATLQPGRVIGLFAKDGLTTFVPEPSLAEMSDVAIQLLNASGKEWFGPQPKFFLMVEGSQIDWASHANDTDRVVRQTLQFDMAVREAIEFARRDRHTLVIVTADHETGGLKLVRNKRGELKAKWTTGGHKAANVPLFAYGPGSEKFAGTIDNTEIPRRIAELTGIPQFPVPVNLPQIAETAAIK